MATPFVSDQSSRNAERTENLVPHMAQLATYNQKKVQEKDQQIIQLTEDLRQELKRNRQKIDQLEKENEALLTSLLEKKDEIAQLKDELCVKDKATADKFTELREEITQLQKNMREKDEAMRQEIVELKQDQRENENKMIAQLKTIEEEAKKEVDAIKEEISQIQEHICKKDEAVRQEIVQLKQESENEMIARLKTTEEKAQKKDEMLQQEIAMLKRRQENAVSKEESEAIKQKIAELLRETSVSKEELKQKIIQLGKKQKETVSKEDYETTKQELTQLKAKQEEDRSSLQTLQSYTTTPPVEFTMTEFVKHKRDNDIWYSEPFYTHPHGYKMCLRVYANGCGDGKDTHASVFCCLMQGEFDDHLRWPFLGDITIRLMNHLADKEHHTTIINFSIKSRSVSNGRVTTGERAPNGHGTIKFLPHSELGHDLVKNYQFLKDDCLRFQVTRVTNLDWTSLERQCLAIASRVCVPPFEFTMRDFEQQKGENDRWFSPSFYTHPQEYRMCLYVDANGTGSGKGTHVSVYVCLMRGEFDNYLKWPFRGDITIQLLNQIEDKGHHEITIHFTDKVPDSSTGRVTTTERCGGLGLPQFISHNALNYNKTKNCQYLKYNCLRFKITKVELKS